MNAQTRCVRAEGALAGELGDVAVKLCYFVSPDVTAVRRPAPDRLEIDLDPRAAEGAEAAVQRDVTALIARLAAGYRPLPPRTLFARGAPPPTLGGGAAGVTDALETAGWARRQGPGAYAFGPRFVALLEALDARLRRLAREVMGAEECVFPALIGADVLHRAGYLASFPQHVSFVVHLPQRADALERFRAANAGTPRFALPPACTPDAPAECLPPAVCHHRFGELAGERLPGGAMITARGACFRYEARHAMRDLSRLWCFQMREVVYTGDEGFVRSAAGRAAAALEALTDELGLGGACATASDPFFADVFAEKRYAQRAGERKHELCVPLGGGETLAVASINAHDDVFGKAFSIRDAGGATAVSGCLAFGLERLAVGFLAQHGLDDAAWPAGIATAARARRER